MFGKPAFLLAAATVLLLAQGTLAHAQMPTIPGTNGMPLPSPSWMQEHDMPGWQDRGGARIPTYEAPMPGPTRHHASTDTGHVDTRAADEDFQRNVDGLASALSRLQHRRKAAQQRAASGYYEQASCPPGYAPHWYGADLTGKPILTCQ